jgi:hypothetical protein
VPAAGQPSVRLSPARLAQARPRHVRCLEHAVALGRLGDQRLLALGADPSHLEQPGEPSAERGRVVSLCSRREGRDSKPARSWRRTSKSAAARAGAGSSKRSRWRELQKA